MEIDNTKHSKISCNRRTSGLEVILEIDLWKGNKYNFIAFFFQRKQLIQIKMVNVGKCFRPQKHQCTDYLFFQTLIFIFNQLLPSPCFKLFLCHCWLLHKDGQSNFLGIHVQARQFCFVEKLGLLDLALLFSFFARC